MFGGLPPISEDSTTLSWVDDVEKGLMVAFVGGVVFSMVDLSFFFVSCNGNNGK
jgi:hypothetical protein